MEWLSALQRRYGTAHDYSLLHRHQRTLLLDPGVKDDVDGGGFHTVSVNAVSISQGIPVLALEDSMSYLWHRTNPGVIAYSARRIPIYSMVLETQEPAVQNNSIQLLSNPRELLFRRNVPIYHPADQTAVFQSPGLEVRVRFSTQKYQV